VLAGTAVAVAAAAAAAAWRERDGRGKEGVGGALLVPVVLPYITCGGLHAKIHKVRRGGDSLSLSSAISAFFFVEIYCVVELYCREFQPHSRWRVDVGRPPNHRGSRELLC